MPGTAFDLSLRPATLDDAALVADLDTVRDPDDPHDPVTTRYWWEFNDTHDRVVRHIAVQGGEALAYVAGWHQPWETTDDRFGNLRATLRPEQFSERRLHALVSTAEDWLRGEGVRTAITRAREDFPHEVGALGQLGYREHRRQRTSELDLEARRDHVRQTLETSREEMRRQGVALLTLSRDEDADKLTRLYEMMLEAEQDIPTTAPWRVLQFEEWRHYWFDHPGIREDRFWVAREGEAIVGMSTLDFPVMRGVPYTALTATARSVRGRGIARALKYESMNQAIELGYTRVRTNNDADNAPILRINQEMGYRLVVPVLELHRDLER